MSIGARSPYARAALEAALAGALFFAVEALLVWHLPALWRGGAGVSRGSWAYSSMLAVLYPLVTATLACFVTLGAHAPLRARSHSLRDAAPLDDAPRTIAVIALSTEVALALLGQRHRPTGTLLVSFAIGLVVAGALALAWPRIARRLACVLNAPAAVALLILPGWISGEFVTQSWGLLPRAVPIAVVFAILAIAWLAGRHRESPIGEGESTRGGRLRRNVVATAAAWTFVLVLGCIRVEAAPALPPIASAKSAPARRPNVLLVVLDTVRADHLSLYGYERATTPNLERLAASSVVFDQAISAGDMTLSSHASLFTGLAPRTHGAHFDARGKPLSLAGKFVTLAERLRDAGWSTLGIAANHAFFANRCGLEQGFSTFDSHPPFEFEFLVATGELPWFTLAHGCHDLVVALAPPRSVLRNYRDAEQITAQGRAWIDTAAGANRPFFLFLNLMDAHWPCIPPAPYEGLFPGRSPRLESPAWRYAMVDDVVRRAARGVTDEERAHMLSQYDGAIAYMDVAVGALIEHLEQRGLLDDTLVIVTSDHGEAFGEHGLVGHAVSVFEDQLHVPLIVRPPGGVAGRREVAQASLIDVSRTVLTAVGIEAGADVGGRDLLGPAPAQPPACCAESYPNPTIGGSRLDRVQSALRTANGWKLIRTSGQPDALFELHSDPGELRDLATTAEQHAELARAFDAWLEANPQTTSVDTSGDAANAARLRSLGY